jgi:hypothetical protein
MCNKNENDICVAKLQYKCGVCGEVYNSIQERMRCEMKCIEKQKEEERKAAAEKKKQEKAARKAEVDEALAKFTTLAEAYSRDYGSYIHCDESSCSTWPSIKLLHHFFD